MANKIQDLFGLTLEEYQNILVNLGEPTYRAKQIMSWVYQKKVTQFDEMTNLPAGLREKLKAHYALMPPHKYQRFESSDGSVKYVFDFPGGVGVEAVFMQMPKGVTLCLSSQVGCAQDCSFCLTAQMGFVRNLTPGEIVGQAFAIAIDQNLEGPFNVVMMGMGEPLLNVNNLIKSLDIFTHPLGMDLSPKRITVSTSGHVRNLQKLSTYEKLPRIAISLNASTDEQRNHLMPVNLKWNIRELIDACKLLPIPPRDRITFEYVLIRGINDSPADARRVVKLLNQVRCKVNIIPFNETEGLPYQQPELHVIETFREILTKGHILNTVRWSKGRDIGAACGQLARPVSEKGAHLRKQTQLPMASTI